MDSNNIQRLINYVDHFRMQVKYALVYSTVAGVIFNYFSYKDLVFRRKANAENFAKHILAYCVVYFFNVNILILLSQFLTKNFYIAQLICIPMLVILSWVLMNKWVYK